MNFSISCPLMVILNAFLCDIENILILSVIWILVGCLMSYFAFKADYERKIKQYFIYILISSSLAWLIVFNKLIEQDYSYTKYAIFIFCIIYFYLHLIYMSLRDSILRNDEIYDTLFDLLYSSSRYYIGWLVIYFLSNSEFKINLLEMYLKLYSIIKLNYF
jgi:hypothetical protein